MNTYCKSILLVALALAAIAPLETQAQIQRTSHRPFVSEIPMMWFNELKDFDTIAIVRAGEKTWMEDRFTAPVAGSKSPWKRTFRLQEATVIDAIKGGSGQAVTLVIPPYGQTYHPEVPYATGQKYIVFGMRPRTDALPSTQLYERQPVGNKESITKGEENEIYVDFAFLTGASALHAGKDATDIAIHSLIDAVATEGHEDAARMASFLEQSIYPGHEADLQRRIPMNGWFLHMKAVADECPDPYIRAKLYRVLHVNKNLGVDAGFLKAMLDCVDAPPEFFTSAYDDSPPGSMFRATPVVDIPVDIHKVIQVATTTKNRQVRLTLVELFLHGHPSRQDLRSLVSILGKEPLIDKRILTLLPYWTGVSGPALEYGLNGSGSELANLPDLQIFWQNTLREG